MTPIEQQIQAAIEAGHSKWAEDPLHDNGFAHYTIPLVMTVLKPLLDDARTLAEYMRRRHARQHDSLCDCLDCQMARRILSATEPGPGEGKPITLAEWVAIAMDTHKKAEAARAEARKQEPGADSSPLPKGGVRIEDDEHKQAVEWAKANALSLVASVPPGPLSEITLCPRCEGCGVYNFGPCSLCNATGRLGFDGKAFKPVDHEPPSPTSNCTHNWNATCFHCASKQSRQAAAGVPDNDGRRTKRVFYPCEIDRHDICGVENPIAICTCPCHAIPTITGSADAMKTPGPAPLGIGGGTGFVSTHDFLELTNRVAALEKGKVAT